MPQAAVEKISPTEPRPRAKPSWDNVTRLPESNISQDKAIEVILAANAPVIVITEDSAHAYTGMMKYISESFPNIPIIFEKNPVPQKGMIDDRYMAQNVLKGDMKDKRARAHFCEADVLIVLGRKPLSIQQQAGLQKTVLSSKTVRGGVNIAIASFIRADDMRKNAGRWATWNTRQISPSRCLI